MPNDKNTAIEQQKELIRLQAEIERLQKMYHQHPRRKFISAITQDPVYRPYMFKVIKKIEDFGNKNYPDDRSYSKLKGKLTATIVIKRDGSLEDVVINISSGSDLLDAYAKKVATMAAPYDPLPITEQDIDFLHITRTWGFGNPAGESANH